MNFKVEYLSRAISDLKDAMAHISNELGMPKAASELVENIVHDIESLTDFPYSHPAYTPIQPLKHDYRKMVVQNYSVFYWVDEQSKIVTIARVLYNRRNFLSILR